MLCTHGANAGQALAALGSDDARHTALVAGRGLASRLCRAGVRARPRMWACATDQGSDREDYALALASVPDGLAIPFAAAAGACSIRRRVEIDLERVRRRDPPLPRGQSVRLLVAVSGSRPRRRHPGDPDPRRRCCGCGSAPVSHRASATARRSSKRSARRICFMVHLADVGCSQTRCRHEGSGGTAVLRVLRFSGCWFSCAHILVLRVRQVFRRVAAWNPNPQNP